MTRMGVLLLRDERQQRQVARPLDGVGQHALVARGSTGDPAREDLGVLQDVLLEELDVLVVDVLDAVRAELADLAAAEEHLLTRYGAHASLASSTARSRPPPPLPPRRGPVMPTASAAGKDRLPLRMARRRSSSVRIQR